jgi:NitT/TauT family transport system substrate-binding protein
MRIGKLLAALIVSLVPALAQAQERKLVFTLDFIALGRHAAWYVPIAKGYYKAEGLDVAIIPSKGTADAIKNVDSGVAQLGFIDVPSLVAAGGAAAAVKMVAVNYQKPPYCVFSLNPGANVSAPKDMVGLEFGSSTGSFMPRIAQAFMKMHGLDSSTLRVVNIDGAARVPMLAARKVQSIDQFIMSEPAIRRAVKDAEPKCMLFGDYGLDIYSNGIGVREDFLQQNPEVVRRFVRAALRGWKDAMANPEEAAKIQVQFLKALDQSLVVDELKTQGARPIAGRRRAEDRAPARRHSRYRARRPRRHEPRQDGPHGRVHEQQRRHPGPQAHRRRHPAHRLPA